LEKRKKKKIVNGYQRKRNAYRKCVCESKIDGVLPFWAIFEVSGRERERNEGKLDESMMIYERLCLCLWENAKHPPFIPFITLFYLKN
jgi:hypothetical protein